MLYDRLQRAIGYAGKYLPSDVAKELNALRQPEALAAMVVMFGIVAYAQLTPLGWVADLAAFLVGIAALGFTAVQVADDVRQFVSLVSSAENDADLDSAGRHLARAISVVGVGTLLLWLTKRAGKMAIGTKQLVGAAQRVALNAKGREIALWSGIDPLKLPARFATLELMLSDSRAGRALMETLKRRNDFKRDQDVWFTLSERVAEAAAKSKKEVHYFVAESRGFRKALATGDVVKKWWRSTGMPELINGIRAEGAKKGTPTAEIESRIARLSNWTQEEIEAHYYSQHRRSKHDPTKFEDEIFHKLEKLQLDHVTVHELDAAGKEVGKPFDFEF